MPICHKRILPISNNPILMNSNNNRFLFGLLQILLCWSPSIRKAAIFIRLCKKYHRRWCFFFAVLTIIPNRRGVGALGFIPQSWGFRTRLFIRPRWIVGACRFVPGRWWIWALRFGVPALCGVLWFPWFRVPRVGHRWSVHVRLRGWTLTLVIWCFNCGGKRWFVKIVAISMVSISMA